MRDYGFYYTGDERNDKARYTMLFYIRLCANLYSFLSLYSPSSRPPLTLSIVTRPLTISTRITLTAILDFSFLRPINQ